MKNNYVKLVLMALVAMMCFVPVIEAKNAPKKKKEKKKFEWVMPEKMTGIEDFDKYLLTCDTLWNRITTYRDSIHFFRIDTVLVQDQGMAYYDVQIRDEEGNKRSWAQSIQQGLDMIFTGTDIVLDAANITLMTATATLSLTENPLLAFSYGKYLKAGPKIVGLAYNEVKEIVNRTKEQMRTMKEIHKSIVDKSTDTDILIPAGDSVNLEECTELSSMDIGNQPAQDVPDALDDPSLLENLEVKEPEE